MGSEGEIIVSNPNVYVAVGRNVKDGKSLLNWAVKNFEGKYICLLHVHQPMNFVTLLKGKLSASKLKDQAIKACQEIERLKMQKLMNQYLVFLSRMGIQADKLCIETSNIEKGILQLISQHRIRCLVMGTAVETSNTKKLSELSSSRANFVSQQAPPSCHIYFICKESLKYSRPVDSGRHLTTTITLASSTTVAGTTLTADLKENIDATPNNVKCLEHSSKSDEEVVRSVEPTTPCVDQRNGDDSPLSPSMNISEHSTLSPSHSSPDCESYGKETSDLHGQLEYAMAEAENAKQKAFEESLKRWRAEEDAFEAVRQAEAAKMLCEEEMCRKKEIEELLIRQKEEMEAVRVQHDQSLKDLTLIREKIPVFESQLREASSSEKELEDKIIQAVNLLIKFKETRDNLLIEHDSAIRQVNKIKIPQTENPLGISRDHFFGISFSDIIEATQNFNHSQRIGEGRFGSVFRGVISHVKVAIKMLPSTGSQSDSEFKQEVEVLSRVRHPNLVTLIAACPESRTLIYEYIENSSLADYLSGKIRPLKWLTRIKIAIEICSALVFLHANDGYNRHGNLKPSNVLLDTNFVSKISDFGIHNLICKNENHPICPKICSKTDPEVSAYTDPESYINGELTAESDVYSFGIILLRLLTGRPAIGVIRDVKCAMETGKLDGVLDTSGGDWPLELAKELADLALRCCQKNHLDRPRLASELRAVLQPMKDLCDFALVSSASPSLDSSNRRKVPSHFVCPIYQEIMKDPHIAADGFTYEGEAISGWFASGANTSPMTNLKLDNCDLIPNYALYYAIQEWQQNT